jgi:hypothetical protein
LPITEPREEHLLVLSAVEAKIAQSLEGVVSLVAVDGRGSVFGWVGEAGALGRCGKRSGGVSEGAKDALFPLAAAEARLLDVGGKVNE